MSKNLAEFLAAYDPEGTRVLADIIPARDADGSSPFVVVRHGRFAAVLALMPFDDHLCIDVHPFADEQDATAGIFGMTEGRRHTLPDTGTTSYGWPSVNLVSVLIGEQAEASGESAELSGDRHKLSEISDALQDACADPEDTLARIEQALSAGL